MSFANWIRRLSKKRYRKLYPRGYRPVLEMLELRLTPAYQTSIAAGTANFVSDAGDISALNFSFDSGTNRYTLQDTNGITFNVTSDPSGAVVSGNGTATLTLDGTLVSEFSVDLGDQNDLMTVQSTDAASLTIDLGSGDDTITLQGTSSLGDAVDGGTGSNTLSYQGYSTGVTVDLSTGAATGVPNGVSNFAALQGGTGNDTLAGNAAGTTTFLASDGTDTVTGNGGTNTLIGQNAASQFTLAGGGPDTLQSSGGTTTFSGIQNLTGGNSNDTITFNGDSVTGTVDGGGGTNALDYSLISAGVTVNLAAGTATSTGGIANINQVTGSSGDDSLTGSSGNDTLAGGPGNDTLTGGAGNDSLAGGSGDDSYFFGSGYGTDTVTENSGEGTDSLDFSALSNGLDVQLLSGSVTVSVSSDKVTASGTNIEHILGGSGNDTFTFANGASFAGGAGTLDGGGGSANALSYALYVTKVTVNLTAGTSTGTGGVSNFNFVMGGAVGDALTGSAGNDTLRGVGGNDTLIGGGGDDSLDGGTGNDTYVFTDSFGHDSITENSGAGTDTLDMSAVSSALTIKLGSINVSDASGDTITYTQSSIEKIIGGSGNDTFTFSNGASVASGGGTLDGGGGTNTLDYSNYTTGVTVNLGTGTATGTSGVSNFNAVTGGSGNDSLTGSSGNDTLTGGLGNDTLTGGAGDDSLAGGGGDDSYIFGSGYGTDTVTENSGEGTDSMDFSALSAGLDAELHSSSVTVGEAAGPDLVTASGGNVEHLLGGSGSDTFTFDNGATFAGGAGTLDGGGGNANALSYALYVTKVTVNLTSGTSTGTAGVSNFNFIMGGAVGDSLTGGSGNDTLRGVGGNDTINGGGGDDSLDGGTGNDTYAVTNGFGHDSITENSGAGTDTLDMSAVSSALTIKLGSINVSDAAGDTITYTQNSIEKIIGGTGDDTFTFSNGASVASGGGTLDGGTGTNTLDYSSYTTGVTVNLGTGTATGTGGVSNFNAVTGGSVADSLTGSSGNDTLTGGSGNDTLTGGAGNDSLAGGTGNDRYVFASGWGTDTVTENSGEGTDSMDFSAVTSSLTETIGAGVTVSDGTNTATASGNVENVQGGIGNDSFTFAATGSITGNVDGGPAGNDSLDLSAISNSSVTVTGSGTNHGFKGTATGIAGTFDNIDSFKTASFVVDGPAQNNTLALKEASGTLEFTLNGTTGSLGGTTSFTFNGADGFTNDMTVDYTGGAFVLSGGISFNGGALPASPGNSLTILGGTFTTETYNYTSAHNGSLVLDASGGQQTITFTNLTPLTNTGTAADIIFNLPAGTVGATLQDDGPAGNGLSQLVSTNSTFETTTFADPTGSLTVNAGGGTDTISTSSNFSGDFAAALTISGTAATDTVTLNALTLGNAGANTGTLTVTANTVAVNGAVNTSAGSSGLVTLTAGGAISGTGSITAPSLALSANSGIGTAGQSLTTAVSNLEAESDTGGVFITNTGTLNVGGVSAGLAGVRALSSGDVQLINTGTVNVITNGDTVRGPANVTVEALGAGADVVTGGQTSLAAIRVLPGDSGKVLVQAGQDILVGNSGSGSVGADAGLVTLTAGRDIVVDNQSAAGNFVFSATANGGLVATAGRNVLVTNGSFLGDFSTSGVTVTAGTAGSGNISVLAGGAVNSAGGAIALTTGTGGTFTLSGVDSTVDSQNGSGGGGPITISADDMDIADPINAATGVVTLQQAGASTERIDLGGAGSGTRLALSDAELGEVTTSVLKIGRTDNAGAITVTAPIASHTGYSTLDLFTAGVIDQTAGSTLAVTNLSVQAAGGVNLGQANPVSTLTGTTSGTAFTFLASGSLTVTALTTSGGAITVGTASGNLSVTGAVTAGSAPISFTAGGTDSTFANTSTVTDDGASAITVTADRMNLGAVITNTSTGRVTLQPQTASRPIDLGSTTDPTGTLSLSNNELNEIQTGGVLQVGNSSSGGINVSATIFPAGVLALSLETGGGVSQAAGTHVTVPELAVRAASAVTLDQGNNVGQALAAAVTGAVQGFTFVQDFAAKLTVGSVDGLSGISTNGGAVAVSTTNSDFEVDQNISAGAAAIDLVAGGAESLFTNKAALSTTGGNTLDVEANRMDLAGGTLTAAGGGGVELEGTTAGRPTDLGPAGDSTGVLRLSAAELNTVTTTGLLQVGDGAGGAMTVSAAIDLTNAASLELRSGGTVTVNAKLTVTDNLTVSATGTITVNAALDPTTVTLTSDDDVVVNAPVTATNSVTVLAGQDGTGSATVTGSGSLAATGAGGDVVVVAGSTSGGIALSGNVSAVDEVYLNSFGGISQSGGAVKAANLLMLGGGTFSLVQPGNDVTTLAAGNSGPEVEFRDANDLTLGALTDPSGVFGVNGISAVGAVNLQTGGTLQLNQPLNVGTGAARLVAGGNVGQAAAGTVTADALGIRAFGDVLLAASPANDVSLLAVASLGAVHFTDNVGFSVGSLASGGNAGFTATTGVIAALDIVLTATDTPGPGNNITVPGTITVASTGSSVALQAGDILDLQAGSVVAAATSIAGVVDFGNVGPAGGTANVNGSLFSASAAFTGDTDPDTFNVTPSATTPITINGKAPTGAGTAPGDVLNISLTGVTNPFLAITSVNGDSKAGSYTFGNRQSVGFTDVETLSPGTADFAITKTDGQTTAVPGTRVTYTVTVQNNGLVGETGVTVTDLFPAPFTTVDYTSTATGGATGNTARGSGNIGDTLALPAGAIVTYTITAGVDASAVGSLSNTATVTAPTLEPDGNPGDNSATDTDTLTPQVDLKVTKAGAVSVTAGTDLTYTVSVSNNGSSDAHTLSLTDVVPAGTTFKSANQTGGPAVTLTTPAVGATGTIRGQAATFAAGASATFTFVVHINPNDPSGATVSNTATAGSADTELSPTDNSASSSAALFTSADLAVTKTTSGPEVVAGTQTAYTITVTNNGPSDAQAVSLLDNIPAGTTFVSLTRPVGWSTTTPAVGGTGPVSASITTLAAGASGQFILVVEVNPSAVVGSTISNTATADTRTTDSSGANNSATANLTVTHEVDLVVLKSADPDPANTFQNLTYTIQLANTGPSTATGTRVTDTLPAGVAFFSAAASQGTFTHSGNSVTFTVGDTLPSVEITLTVVVRPLHPGSITNTATATSDTADSLPDDNTDAITTSVNVFPPASLATANANWLNHVYLDLLHRGVDPSGLGTFTKALAHGASRADIVLQIEASFEFRAKLVNELYISYLHRPADPTGLNNGIAFLQGGGSRDQLKALILGSFEYFERRGGGTNNGWLDAVYADVVHRPVDAQGRRSWGMLLANGFSRTQVAGAILRTPEADAVEVRDLYLRYLRRPTDARGLATFTAALQAGTRDEVVIAALLASDEYFDLV